ncbi:permease-like cell division protein FtsX [Myxococcota bacterium]|nr:permease-like cell division protein FtsX [Myxococcota bacterium]MBU1382715.1 permease-like cell division protein FtsX [Myxococcota bacterium]MBU1496011.1 permease-like cell division protein FtsX [Myxococcota bacterium]
MMNLYYYFIQSLKAFRRKPLTHLLTVGTIALTLTLAGGITLTANALRTISEKWGSGAMVAVYLKDGLPEHKVETIRKKLTEIDGVTKTRVISKDLARKRLIQSLEGDADLVKSVENEFFPVSIEVVIHGETEKVNQCVEKMKKLSGVVAGITDVRDVHTWNKKVGHVLDIVYLIGIILMIIVLVSTTYIIMVTTRLTVENHLSEIKLIKLLGARSGFINTPVIFEAMLTGLAGAALSLLFLWAAGHFGLPGLKEMLGSSWEMISVNDFLNIRIIGLGCAFGLLSGLLSGKLALMTVKT